MEITNKDIFKHYISSIIIYGILLVILFFIPAFNQEITNPFLSYFGVLIIYYILYVLFAYPIFKKLRPKSIITSRNVVILNYFRRQLQAKIPLDEKLNNMNLNEDEKQAFTILFIKTFFGVYSLNLLCGKYLPQLGYNIDFIGAMLEQGVQYTQISGVFGGILQFIDDTADIWLILMFTINTLVFSISYLTEAGFLKNKIKYADTTPLGILSCIICFYPFILLTDKFIPVALKEIIPIENLYLRLTVYILAIIANIISMIAILRLGTRVGNLTNRGIVTSFPYNIVRHPDYGMQIFYIILTFLPLYAVGDLNILGNIVLTLGMFIWIGIYVLRAITEERNLIKDENYKTYAQKVKYRFIPFVY